MGRRPDSAVRADAATGAILGMLRYRLDGNDRLDRLDPPDRLEQTMAAAVWRLLALLALLLAWPACGWPATIESVELARPDGARHYLLAVPQAQHSGPRSALIILLHGHGGSASQLLGLGRSVSPMSLWLRLSDREGLLLAAADGMAGSDGKQGWNDCRAHARTNPKTDDVGFLDAIATREVREHGADPDRIFVMGMSNGGMMAFRYAIESGGRLAGFAAVSASMAASSLCPSPTQPVPALIISGTADPLVPYAGGPVGWRLLGARDSVIGIEAAAAVWQQVNGLSASAPVVTLLEHRDASDPTRALRMVWREASNPAEVALVRIEGGGHVEPSTSQRVAPAYTRLVGVQNADFEVVDEAWGFFRDKHRTAPR